jgi:hypothetical protein
MAGAGRDSRASSCPVLSGAVALLEIESFELSQDTMTGNILVIVTTVRGPLSLVPTLLKRN